MSADPIYCPAVAYPATRDNPQELCENEVENGGDLCGVHDAEDRADADYEAYRDMRREELVMDR